MRLPALFQKALDALRSDIQKISSSIDAAAASNSAKNRDQQPEVRVIVSGDAETKAGQKDATDHRKRAEERDKKRLNFEMAGVIVASVIAVANAGILIVAMLSARTAEIAAHAAETGARAAADQPNAAKLSVETTAQNFRLEQRAIIWLTNDIGSPTFVSKSGQVIWTWHFTNYGKTPCRTITFRHYIKIGSRPFTPSFGEPESSIGSPMAPGEVEMATVVSPPLKITESEYNKLLQQSRAVSIKGDIQYSDIFGQSHESHFCLFRLNTGAIGFCREGNSMQ